MPSASPVARCKAGVRLSSTDFGDLARSTAQRNGGWRRRQPPLSRSRSASPEGAALAPGALGFSGQELGLAGCPYVAVPLPRERRLCRARLEHRACIRLGRWSRRFILSPWPLQFGCVSGWIGCRPALARRFEACPSRFRSGRLLATGASCHGRRVAPSTMCLWINRILGINQGALPCIRSGRSLICRPASSGSCEGWRKWNGGEGGIRTHGTLAGTTVFETAPIDHSGTSPRRQG
jgi:hypothetical protein